MRFLPLTLRFRINAYLSPERVVGNFQGRGQITLQAKKVRDVSRRKLRIYMTELGTE